MGYQNIKIKLLFKLGNYFNTLAYRERDKIWNKEKKEMMKYFEGFKLMAGGHPYNTWKKLNNK